MLNRSIKNANMIKFVDDTAIHVLEDENDLKMYKEEVSNFVLMC